MLQDTRTVAIVQRTLKHYRLAFFNQLRERLACKGIRLLLIYGTPENRNGVPGERAEIEWAYPIDNHLLRIGRKELYWQPCLRLLRNADLIIVEQASRLLVNYILLVQQALGTRKVAFWGHGRNLRIQTASRFGEALKTRTSKRVHWWFAYNTLSWKIIRELGFPENRITNVQNAIDTAQLAAAYHQVSSPTMKRLRQELGLRGEDTCLYIGSMYAEKRLDFLVQAGRLIQQEHPSFELLLIGGGQQAGLIAKASAQHAWMHYVGPKFDLERVPYFKLSKLLLLPGLVGLAVLDAFCLETPLVTVNVPFHSPEIDYLEPGVNGVIVDEAGGPAAFARAVVQLLNDDEGRCRLVEGCRRAAQIYTVEEMSARFCAGIEHALDAASA